MPTPATLSHGSDVYDVESQHVLATAYSLQPKTCLKLTKRTPEEFLALNTLWNKD